eukprot:TRINITY_DN20416_c0_g1_i1.p1 TRINITY_DN20416_c0_g1~~TRINITY_DN20416_c0_g1_i1.p1  ORF type:complete len:494 (+),score=45.79 TRINITY_DN20416_c0_g1_i1:64-1545(+)
MMHVILLGLFGVCAISESSPAGLIGLECAAFDDNSLLALSDVASGTLQGARRRDAWTRGHPRQLAHGLGQRRQGNKLRGRGGNSWGAGRTHAGHVGAGAARMSRRRRVHESSQGGRHSWGRQDQQEGHRCGSRKEITRWTDAEFERFARAINHMKQDGTYDQYVMEHEDGMHGMRGFFQWHHDYLNRFERDIRKVLGDDCFGLPYWDEAADSGRENSAAVWRRDRLGSLPRGGCIASVYFRWQPCIQRAGRFSRRNRLANKLQVQSVIDRMRAMDVGRLRLVVEDGEGFHSDGHVFIGGSMSQIDHSPYDPIFWLHHAYYDYIRELSLVSGGNWVSLLQSGREPSTKYVERAYPDDDIERESTSNFSLQESLRLGIKYCNQRKLTHCLNLIRTHGMLQNVPRITGPACPVPRQTLTPEEVKFEMKWEQRSHQHVSKKQRQQAVDDSEVIYRDDWPTMKPSNLCDEQVCFCTNTVMKLCMEITKPTNPRPAYSS